MLEIDIRKKPISKRAIIRARKSSERQYIGWSILRLLGAAIFVLASSLLAIKHNYGLLASTRQELLIMLLAAGFLLFALITFMETEYVNEPSVIDNGKYIEVNNNLAIVIMGDLVKEPEIDRYWSLVQKQGRLLIRAEIEEMKKFCGYKQHHGLS